MAHNWTHLVRFIAEEDGQIHLGQVDAKKWADIGLATTSGQKVEAKLVKGSVFDGVVVDKTLHIAQVRAIVILSITVFWLVEVEFLWLTFELQ
jgi:hypothetical protein